MMKARVWGRIARSWSRRYPQELQAAPHARVARAASADHRSFAARWRDAAAQPGLSVAWLGHCSVLLRIGGLDILTDPVFAERIGVALGPWSVGLRRRTPAPLAARDLPTPDLILLSHAHFDHLDQPTLRALASPDTIVITASRTAKLVPRGFAREIELPWDRQVTIEVPSRAHAAVRISAIKPKHWGARTVWDRHRGYNSYLLEAAAPAPTRVLFAGDTAFTHAFDPLARLGGPAGVDLAIMGIAAYDPWEHAHATPEQVWTMATAMRAARILPVHHSTFKLSDEPPDEPISRLLAAAGPNPERVLDAPVGAILTVPINA